MLPPVFESVSVPFAGRLPALRNGALLVSPGLEKPRLIQSREGPSVFRQAGDCSSPTGISLLKNVTAEGDVLGHVL